MFTVFCASHDQAAIWAWDGLRRRGLKPVELVTSECLAFAGAWDHRVGADGAHLKVCLQDGRVLCSSRMRGVLNRLSTPSPELAAHASPTDREYALCEMQAFYLSWLNAIQGVVINRPTPVGLSGAWRHTSEWAMRARRAGLRVPPYRQSAHDPAERGYSPLTPAGAAPVSVIVLRDRIIGAELPDAIESACVRLAQNEGTEMLGLELFLDTAGDWMFGHANPAPWLPMGGEPLLDFLAELFEKGGAA